MNRRQLRSLVGQAHGFTLIEILVVVVVTGLIMTSVVGITLSAMKSQNRTKSLNKISQNGVFILNELKRNILNSNKIGISCPVTTGMSIGVTSLFDGDTSYIGCDSVTGKISSVSAQRPADVVILSGTEVTVSGCDNFVSCSISPSGEIVGVDFSFSLSANTAGVGATKDFVETVTVRN